MLGSSQPVPERARTNSWREGRGEAEALLNSNDPTARSAEPARPCQSRPNRKVTAAVTVAFWK
jgi:hypothetical protein